MYRLYAPDLKKATVFLPLPFTLNSQPNPILPFIVHTKGVKNGRKNCFTHRLGPGTDRRDRGDRLLRLPGWRSSRLAGHHPGALGRDSAHAAPPVLRLRSSLPSPVRVRVWLLWPADTAVPVLPGSQGLPGPALGPALRMGSRPVAPRLGRGGRAPDVP